VLDQQVDVTILDLLTSWQVGEIDCAQVSAPGRTQPDCGRKSALGNSGVAFHHPAHP
jgi:hypothetical protein